MNLDKQIRDIYPTSPLPIFENHKQFKQIKDSLVELSDLEHAIISTSSRLRSGLVPMGLNFHFYNYLAAIYGELFRVIKDFEKALRKAPTILKDYYINLKLPDSKEIYSLMKVDFEKLLPLADEERKEAISRNPNWNAWDSNELQWDTINSNFKGI